MKTYLVLVIALNLILTNICYAIPEWMRNFGGTYIDAGEGVQLTEDGGYILVGGTESYGAGSSDLWLIKTDTYGYEEWQQTFGGASSDWGYAVQQTRDLGYIISGSTYSYGAGSSDVWLIKTDALGNEQWSKTFGGTDLDGAYAVSQISGDWGYIITGYTYSYGAGSSDVFLIRTNSAGNLVWSKTYGGSSKDGGYDLKPTTDGGFIITGYTDSFGADLDNVWLIKTNSSSVQEWQRTFGGNSNDLGYSVIQTSDSGYAITGYTYSYGSGRNDVWLIKTNSSGIEQWNKTFGGTSWDLGHSLLQTADGGFILAGWSFSYGAGFADAWLIKTDPTGSLEWDRLFGGNQWDKAFKIQQTDDSGFIVVGSSSTYTNGQDDVWLFKTDQWGLPVEVIDFFASINK